MRQVVRRLITLATAALLTAVPLSVLGASGASADSTPDDQPLPGYTINNPPLPPILVNGSPSQVSQGVFHHAAYDIETPPQWNGRLVMYAHGYAGQGKVLSVQPIPFGLRQRVLDQGYAWAASSYYDNGYDVRAGVVGTRDLAQLAARKIGHVRQRIIVGASMGGQIVGRSLEQYPRFYAGAMPVCGVLGADNLFDYFLDYNLVAQDLAGVRAYPPPADYLTNAVPRIEQALGLATLTPTGPDTTTAQGKEFRAIDINRSGGQRPGAVPSFAFWKDFVFSLGAPATGTTIAENPGQLATNIFTRYTPNTPYDVNGTVQRVAPADLRDRFSPRLSQSPLVFGDPRVPVLTLHGLGDLFVPFSMEELYQARVAAHGESGLLVQRAIRSTGHCEFSPVEAAAGWDDLIHWINTGIRPAGDPISSPTAVADPTFGCKFSDPAAYASGAGTRRLFPACPAA